MSPKKYNKTNGSNNLSDSDRKEILKKRNTEVKRNNRQKWKQSDLEMQQLYDHNQARIMQLEQMVDGLNRELAGSTSAPKSSCKRTGAAKQNKHEWFGEPF